MKIQLTERELISRKNRIIRMLKSVTTKGGTKIKSIANTSELILGVLDVGRDGSYKDWRFSTNVSRLIGNYFEIWNRSSENESNFVLSRAYLTFFVIRGPNEEDEFLALHSDTTDSSNYKRCPHLHISCSQHPVPKAHIALNLLCIDAIFQTAETFSKAMESGIQMIKQEVFDRIKAI